MNHPARRFHPALLEPLEKKPSRTKDYVLYLPELPRPSLDLLKHNRNNRCGSWTLKGEIEGKLRYARLGCKRWDCPKCGPKKAKRLRHAIVAQATSHRLQRMLTLTLNPAVCSAEESVAYIRRCWDKFRIYMKRQCGASIAFIAILERQKSGYAHLHVLVDRFLAQEWIRQAWTAVGGGRIVDIRHVDLHRVASYLSKYLTKELFINANHRRRVTTSRGIQLFVKSQSGKWQLIRYPIELFLLLVGKAAQAISRDEEGQITSFEWQR